MSKPIAFLSHHLIKTVQIALIVAWLLFLGLSLTLPQLAHADGPTINLGDLPPGKTLTITFRAAITNPLTTSASFICNQALFTSPSFSDTLTNDPTTLVPEDTTCTPLDLPTVSISPGTNPAEAGLITGTFIITTSDPTSPGGMTVSYDLTGSTAANPADYSLAAGPNISALSASTFTIASGVTSATINIVPVDDLIDDDGETVRMTLTNGTGYIVDTSVATRTIIDNDTRGVSVSDTNVNVKEGGAAAQYNVRLDTVPTGTVTISFTTGTQINAITSLTFPANLTALDPQTVTVIATNDAIVEGDHTQIITHTASGGDYTGQSISSTIAHISDNDIAYTLAANQISVAEGDTGSTPITFTLTRTGDITSSSSVDFALGGTATNGTDYSNIIPAIGTITFGAGVTQTQITMNVLGDFIDEADETIIVSLSNAKGTNVLGTGTISGSPASTTITDDDSAGVSLITSTLTISEPNTTAVFTIALTSQPTATVTIALTSTDTTECSVPASVSLTSGNWNTGVPVTVTAVDDLITDGPQPCTIQTSPTSSADPAYNGTFNPADLNFTVNDDDVPTISVSATNVNVKEGGTTAQYNVRLDTVPTATVTVSFNTGTQINAIASLTFPADLTALDPQTVTVVATDDAIVEGDHSQIITHSASGGGFNGATITPVTAHISDNDIAYTLAVNQISVAEGDTGSTPITFTLTRTGDITSSSSVDFALGGTATNGADYNNIVPPVGTITFGAGVTQTQITMNVLGDFIDEADETIIVSLSNAKGTNVLGTGTISGSPASTTITDDDDAGTTVAPITLTVSEPNTTAVFTIALTSQPTATVTIALTSTDTTECTVPASVSLTSVTWTGVPVTVTAVDDLITDGPQPCTIQTSPTSSADPAYNGTFNPADLNFTVNDDDVPTISVSATNVNVKEGGTTAQYNVRLDTVPTATVTVSFNTGTQINAIASLTFPANLTALDPQTVTVIATDDAIVEGDHTQIITHTASGGGFNGATIANVTAHISDNDIGYTLAANQINVAEGNTGSTPIAFTLTRTGDITSSSSVDFGLGGTATNGADYSNVVPAIGTITFGAGVTQTQITMNVLGDFFDEADETVSVSLSNANGTNVSGTGTISGSPASTTITDDDDAGTTVAPTTLTVSEPNTTAVFTIALTSQPLATVTVSLVSTDTTECSVPASVSLTPATWTGVPVTVTAVDDVVTDGPQPCTIQTGLTTSIDPLYSNTFNPDDVNVTVNDDDVPGFRIAPTVGLTTTEAGGTATFSVRLRTQPSDVVTLTLTSGDPGEGDIAPISLTFSTANWNISQTVTITGVNDAIDDGDQPYAIFTNDPSSNDLDYNGAGANPVDVNVTNLDNDTAGFVISPISGNTSEAGITATFTIRLTSQPIAAISIAVSSTDLTEGTVSPAPVNFTPLNWNIPQTVTVTGVDDSIPDGNITYTIQIGPVSGGDSLYSSLNPPDLTLVNRDDDFTGIFLPLVLKDVVSAPNLVVNNLVATSSGVVVTIKNIGNAPAVDPFWVDVYLNPTTAPTHVNQRWQDVGSKGLVWGIQGAALPLDPGESLVLTIGDAYYFGGFSSFTPPLAMGSQVFAQVDSVNLSTTYGNILESHEISGSAYDNIAQIVSTAGTAQAEEPAPSQTTAKSLGRLPGR